MPVSAGTGQPPSDMIQYAVPILSHLLRQQSKFETKNLLDIFKMLCCSANATVAPFALTDVSY